MKTKDIYQSLEKKAVRRSHFFGRSLVVVRKEDFNHYQDYFNESPNIFNIKKNYRTRDWLQHIHAVETGSLIEFHYDFGNVDKSIILGGVHLLLDVVPYFFWFLIRRKKPYEI